MKRNIDKMIDARYDVIIVGGGINGAAIAHMASLNGLKVALLEKDDFASGTSSKSTKLVHGGLRYLENFEFGLVRESLRERSVQLKSSPHLVHALPTIIPVYKNDRRPLWMMKFGVWLYDFLSGKYLIEKYKSLTPDEVVEYIPGIKKNDLVGGVMYYDAQMDDARLCLENVLSAAEYGADVANYTEVRSLLKENGKTVGVVVYDKIGDRQFHIHAQKVVCAAGPWTNIFMKKEQQQFIARVRPTKGVHIVYRRQVSDKALFIQSQQDKRIFFIIPWYGNSLIGTTDTDYQGDPDKVSVEDKDIEYLLSEARRVFPNKEFNTNNIITAFAGLRPLVSEKGSPSKISRKHVLEESYTGIIYVMGGKYTTYRKIAEDTVKLLTNKKLVNTSEKFPVYGSGLAEYDLGARAKQFGVDEAVVKLLVDFYGKRFDAVLELIQNNPELGQPLCNGSKVLKAQVQYALEYEFAQNPQDIVERRLPLIYQDVSKNEYFDYVDSLFNKNSK